MTDHKKQDFEHAYFYDTALGEDTGPRLYLGRVNDYEMAQLIVAAIRNIALQTTDQRLVEYALKLMLEIKKWKDIVVAEEEAKAKVAAGTATDGPYR